MSYVNGSCDGFKEAWLVCCLAEGSVTEGIELVCCYAEHIITGQLFQQLNSNDQVDRDVYNRIGVSASRFSF